MITMTFIVHLWRYLSAVRAPVFLLCKTRLQILEELHMFRVARRAGNPMLAPPSSAVRNFLWRKRKRWRLRTDPLDFDWTLSDNFGVAQDRVESWIVACRTWSAPALTPDFKSGCPCVKVGGVSEGVVELVRVWLRNQLACVTYVGARCGGEHGMWTGFQSAESLFRVSQFQHWEAADVFRDAELDTH